MVAGHWAVYSCSAVRMGSGKGCGEPQEASCQLPRGRYGSRGSAVDDVCRRGALRGGDRKSTRLNSSHGYISYAVFCLKKKNNIKKTNRVLQLAHSSATTRFSRLLFDSARH